MASIAYITDKHMIEFHRLNGNRSICFWKPSNTKKINNFNIGDYLFFLAKGTERGKSREKGITGYGKLKKTYTMTFQQMWKKFESLNGYPTIELLEEAILRVTKQHEMPKTLNCFFLEDVVFFQSPIYLSDIDISISNHIESYFYLDKEKITTTSSVLAMADEVGFDMWSSLYLQQDKERFQSDARINIVHNIHNKITTDIYSSYDESRLAKFVQHCMDMEEDAQYIANSRIIYLTKNQNEVAIYIPCIVNQQDFNKKLQYIIGYGMLFKGYIQLHSFQDSIHVYILFNQTISEELQQVLASLSIAYKEKLVD